MLSPTNAVEKVKTLPFLPHTLLTTFLEMEFRSICIQFQPFCHVYILGDLPFSSKVLLVACTGSMADVPAWWGECGLGHQHGVSSRRSTSLVWGCSARLAWWPPPRQYLQQCRCCIYLKKIRWKCLFLYRRALWSTGKNRVAMGQRSPGII